MDPGWSLPIVYYHTSVAVNGATDFQFGGTLAAKLEADADLALVSPTYVFTEPVLDGQLALSLAAIVGSSVATGSIVLTGPGGGTLSRERTDSIFSFGDLYPTAAIRWNSGTNNFMTYVSGDIPVGEYKAGRLANLGINHWAIDGGGGYTYFDPKAGLEFSVVAGFTYNVENPDTDYQNGIDFHLDGGAAKFLSEQTFVGPVGYIYKQITGDSGNGNEVGNFKSQVVGIGPQFGYLFPIDSRTRRRVQPR